MAYTTHEWVEIDGQRYAVRMPDASGLIEYRPFQQPLEPDALAGLTLQPPFVDGHIDGFRNGLGATTEEIPSAFLAATGMEPATDTTGTGPMRLKVGRQLVEIKSTASAGGYIALAVYNNLLCALRQDSASLDTWDGTTWTNRDFSAALSVGTKRGTSLIVQGNLLYIGTNDARVVFWDGTTFTAGTAGFTAGSTVYLWALRADNQGYWWSEVTATTIETKTTGSFGPEWDGMTHAAGCVIGNNVYYAVRRADNLRQPSCMVYLFDYVVGTSTATPIAEITDNYPTSMVGYRGEMYAGMAWGGAVMKWDGERFVDSLRVGSATPPATTPGTDAVYALFVYGDSLYVALYDATAASGTRTRLYRYRADLVPGAEGTPEESGGWFLVSIGGHDDSLAIRSMCAFQQTLVLGDDETTNGKVYELSKTSRLLSASLTTPDFVYGAPTVPKRYISIRIAHNALVAGQSIAVSYQLNGESAVLLGTNRAVGSTETLFRLPGDVLGTLLRVVLALVNIVGSDLTIISVGVRVLPTQAFRQAWEITLDLAQNGTTLAWSDAVSDPDEALAKLARLTALQVSGEPFQFVGKYLLDSRPAEVALVVFDPMVPLVPEIQEPLPPQIYLPIRILEAGEPENLVLNSSFEQNASPSLPTSWTVMGTGTSAQVSTAVTPADGGNVARLVFNGVDAIYGITQTIVGLIPGRYYTLSAYLRRAMSAGVINVDAFEAVGILDTAGIALAFATDSAFARYDETFLLPLTSSGTIVVRLFGSGTPVGTAYVDAVMLEEHAPVSAFRELGAAV